MEIIDKERKSAEAAHGWLGRPLWEIGELVEAALEGVIPDPPGEWHGRFTVIDGGLS